MMRIRVDINGCEITTLGVWNQDETDDSGRTRYSVYDMTSPLVSNPITLDEYEHVMDVYHDRDDGALGLTERVARAVRESEWDPDE